MLLIKQMTFARGRPNNSYVPLIIAHKSVFVNIIARKKPVFDVLTVQKGHPIKGCPQCGLEKEMLDS